MDYILTVNGGSSSLKCGVFEVNRGSLKSRYRFKFGNILNNASVSLSAGRGTQSEKFPLDLSLVPEDGRHQACLDYVFGWLRENLPRSCLKAIGHRVVHGGEAYDEPVSVDEKVMAALQDFNPLAPLHQPFNLKLIQVCQKLQGDVPQIACFDTMFHIGQAEVERHYAIPQKYSDAGIHRYGFHGLSYEYIYQRLQNLSPTAEQQRIIVCHLGSGASMCAIKNGQSISSTMGFSAVDGLPMGSRSGAIDPGVLLYLQRHYQMDADALEQFLYKDCGWKGVSGISSDMLVLKNSQEPAAQKAIDMFCYRAALEIGKLAAALQGVDSLVFTGGVGENDAELRADIIERCAWLGMDLDRQANQEGQENIGATGSAVDIWKIATNEELMIAQHCLTHLS